MKYKKEKVDGVEIFYREAGDPSKPVLVLYHGFPSSSAMFRDLIPLLEKDFHIIAPDYPGFGQSEAPARNGFDYSFDHLAEIVYKFLKQKGIDQHYMFVFDYGAPIGFRVALKEPEKILGIISSNGNVYEEGLGPKWEARKEYWKHPTPELREQYKSAFAPETVISQYKTGTPADSVSPDGYSLDLYYSSAIPDYEEIQSDLIFDYQNNVKMYPQFQEYLREHQPPLLAVWGKNDPSFIPAGALAFKKDLKHPDIRFVDSGHFALESHANEIAKDILEWKEKLENPVSGFDTI